MIRSLPEELRNKIAAGEIVDGPSSIVKELIENSLDAGATEISVVVEKGGIQTIQVRDNGSGIEADQLHAAVMPYHTSKINKFDDLFSIDTLGFRGEALASIASVSEMSIISNIQDKEGKELVINFGKTADIRPASSIDGTEVTINKLFFNTPARKKFLKTARSELRKVVNVVRRFGLGFPEVSFKLVSDNREIFHLFPEILERRIDHLLDPTYSKHLLPITLVRGDYVLSGFVGGLSLVRKRPGEQYLFLNRRFIKDRLLNSAIYKSYESLVKRGEYPFFIINLIVPPAHIDVNVHPMKTEVKFKDEWRIFNILKASAGESLENLLRAIPDLGKKGIPNYENSTKTRGLFTGAELNTPNKSMNGEQSELSLPLKNIISETPMGPNIERAKDYVSRLVQKKEINQEPMIIENIWQVHKKYIISEINSGLVIIDQHVAHERVLYEDAIKAFETTGIASQTLLFSEKMEFSPDDFDNLFDVLPYLEKIGFKIKKETETSVRILAIPSGMGWGNERQVIREIIDHFLSEGKKYSSHKEGLAASFACKAAVKAGDLLNRDEMQELVNRLFLTEHPYYCPHGRPIIMQLSLEELDKRFERI